MTRAERRWRAFRAKERTRKMDQACWFLYRNEPTRLGRIFRRRHILPSPLFPERRQTPEYELP
jgi:hypothetical protein